jgi:hypothetical protein
LCGNCLHAIKTESRAAGAVQIRKSNSNQHRLIFRQQLIVFTNNILFHKLFYISIQRAEAIAATEAYGTSGRAAAVLYQMVPFVVLLRVALAVLMLSGANLFI